MKGFLAGAIVAVVGMFLAVYIYFAAGFAPVATSAPMMPFERQFAHMALESRIDKEAPKNVAIPLNEENYLAGAHAYLDNCAVCHGAPAKQPTAIARGMFPHPPKLTQGKGVTDDPAGETYWKVANGIRLSGMPGFKDSLSETQMWQISVTLANADKLPPSVTAVLMGQSEAAPPPATLAPASAAPTMPAPATK
jgi:mono/diheme cytochrome c family protein